MPEVTSEEGIWVKLPAKIYLTQGKVALIDSEDYPELNQYKWFAQKDLHTYYAARKSKWIKGSKKDLRSKISMHRVIINAPKGVMVDHINGNGLDNRKSNLRVCTPRQNQQNLVHIKKKSSRFTGVMWNKVNKKWQANITIKNKIKYLGLYDDEREAAKAYERTCRELFGEELICKIGKKRVD